MVELSPYLEGFSRLYDLLGDQASKHLLVQVIAYRILGYRKYKLPLNTPDYWAGIDNIDQFKDDTDYIMANYVEKTIALYRFDLKQLNPPFSIYYRSKSIYTLLNVKQYEYKTDTISIKPEEGDIVLDCGACWGDTALFFSHEVKQAGHVYSFEFVEDNIDVFNTNINLKHNAHLKDHITLVPRPLHETTGKAVVYQNNGSGSRITSDEQACASNATTICIDDFFKEYKLKKVDFIKMDIEGAELSSLKGARNVLQKFRPKLAISIYHSLDDFTQIAHYLHSLNLGYAFYLKHGSIHQEETVLLAAAEIR